MEVVDRPRLARIPEWVVECHWELFCGRRLFEGITMELKACGKEFALACREFGEIVGPICPFDPVPDARFHRLITRLDELEVLVEELRGKM